MRLRTVWGRWGLEQVVDAQAIVICDVLSFCTCVDIAVGRGARVVPWVPGADTTSWQHSPDTLVAGRRSHVRPSLSPHSLLTLTPGTVLVLPSPNGSALTTRVADHPRVLAGCLRNASAVAASLAGVPDVALVAAGERTAEDALRPAEEDWLGVGAIARALEASDPDPMTRMAVAAYNAVASTLPAVFLQIASGVELVERGFPADLDVAAAVDTSDRVPRLKDGAYTHIR